MITVVMISRIKINPLMPISPIVWKVTVSPSSTTEYSSNLLSENFVPAARSGCLKKVFPKMIPNRMAKVAPPSLGKNKANSFAMIATPMDKLKPGKIGFVLV